jgi:hypothetical protein
MRLHWTGGRPKTGLCLPQALDRAARQSFASGGHMDRRLQHHRRLPSAWYCAATAQTRASSRGGPACPGPPAHNPGGRARAAKSAGRRSAAWRRWVISWPATSTFPCR